MTLIQEFVNYKVWAVVGVSNNRRKFGNIIYRDMQAAGYEVYGVNPHEDSLDGQPLYPSLADLPVTPDVVDIVVPPEITEQIVRECHALGLRRVWMQPGAESAEAVDFCHANGIEVISGGPCAMVHKKYWH
jgi:predicted CoA-binding protein